MGKRPNTVLLRYGYKTVLLRYGYNTVRISAPVNTDRYGPKTDRIYTVYRRKYPVFTVFSVRKRSVNDTVLIDLSKNCRINPKKGLYMVLEAEYFFEDSDCNDKLEE